MTVINRWTISPCPYLNPEAFHYVFSPQAIRGGEWQNGFGEQLTSSQGQPNLDEKELDGIFKGGQGQ